jgi:hypothetical protein
LGFQFWSIGGLVALSVIPVHAFDLLYTIEHDIDIEAPPSQAWAMLVDLAAYPE